MSQTQKNQSKSFNIQLSNELGTLSYDSSKKYFTVIGLGVFALELFSLVTQNLIVFIINNFFYQIKEYPLAVTLVNYALSFIPLYLVGVPIFIKILKALPTVSPLKQKMKFSHLFAGFCISMFFMLGGNYISSYLLDLIQSAKGSELTNPVQSATEGNPWWLNFVFVALLAPVLEELVFRKLLCGKLLPLGEGWAIFISAAVFGLGHGNFYQLFYAFALGAFFAFIYVKTGKIIYSMIYHIAINTLGGVVAPWLNQLLSDPKLQEYLSSADGLTFQNMESGELARLMTAIFALAAYNLFMIGAAIAGVIIFIKAAKAKLFALEGGLLPPIKKGKFSALFLNIGTALSIALFSLLLLRSITG